MTRLIALIFRGHPTTIRMTASFTIGMSVAPVLVWYLTLPVPGKYLVAFYSVIYVLFMAVVTSNSLRTRLSSHRAHTVPGYRRANVAVILGLAAITLALATGLCVYGGLPLTPATLCLWTFWALGWITGYFIPGLAFNFPRFLSLILLLVAILGAAAGAFGSAVTLGGWRWVFQSIGRGALSIPWELAVVLVLANTAVTMLMVRRLLHLNEESFEYFRINQREIVQNVYRNAREPRLTALDSIQTPLPARLGPQLRHLAMALFPARPSFLRFAGTLTAMLLIVRFALKIDAMPALVGVAIGIPAASFLFTRQTLSRFFLLPLSRRELVVKGGSAMLLMAFRGWCGWMLAGAIAFQGIPLRILLITLVMQLPFFGLCALAVSVRAPFTRGKPLLMLLLLLAVGMLVKWISTTPVQVQVAVCVVAGGGLIWLAFQRWCNVELD